MAWTTLEVEFFFSFLISISICERGQDQYLQCILRSLSRNRMKDSIKHDGQNFSMNEREAREEEREDWKFLFSLGESVGGASSKATGAKRRFRLVSSLSLSFVAFAFSLAILLFETNSSFALGLELEVERREQGSCPRKRPRGESELSRSLKESQSRSRVFSPLLRLSSFSLFFFLFLSNSLALS